MITFLNYKMYNRKLEIKIISIFKYSNYNLIELNFIKILLINHYRK